MRGAAHLVCITGDAGMGKTRLAEELLADAQRAGYRAARTRAYALEGRLAYAPVADWLRSPALAACVSALPAIWRTEIARLLPELLIEDAALLPPQPLTERWQVKRLFEALLQAFSSAAQQASLLLVLDDLQWCDPETLEWLHYALSAAPQLKLFIVGTVRDTEVDADHSLHKLWRALLQDGHLTHLPLLPLSQAETTQLGTTVLQRPLDGSLADRLFDVCSGNPLFVIETVRFQYNDNAHNNAHTALQSALVPQNGLAPLPPRVYAVLQARLAGLSSTARALAEVTAVAGRACTLPLLARAGKWDEAQTALGLDELVQRRLVHEQGDAQFDFSHDRIRDVTYTEIGATKRKLLHRDVAQTIESVYADHLDNHAGELAGHYQQAGDLRQALVYFRQAAATAERLYAHQEVLRYLERAIAVAQMGPDEPEFKAAEIDLWQELGNARLWIYGYGSEPVKEAWVKSHELAMQTGTPFQRINALISLNAFHRTHGEWQTSRAYGEQALSLSKDHDDTFLLGSLFGAYGCTLFQFGELEQALSHLRRAMKLYKTNAAPAQVRKWEAGGAVYVVYMAQVLWLLGFPDQAESSVYALLENIREGVPVVAQLGVFDFSAMLYSFIRNLDAVQKLGDELTEIAQDSLVLFPAMLSNQRGDPA